MLSLPVLLFLANRSTDDEQGKDCDHDNSPTTPSVTAVIHDFEEWENNVALTLDRFFALGHDLQVSGPAGHPVLGCVAVPVA